MSLLKELNQKRRELVRPILILGAVLIVLALMVATEFAKIESLSFIFPLSGIRISTLTTGNNLLCNCSIHAEKKHFEVDLLRPFSCHCTYGTVRNNVVFFSSHTQWVGFENHAVCSAIWLGSTWNWCTLSQTSAKNFHPSLQNFWCIFCHLARNWI